MFRGWTRIYGHGGQPLTFASWGGRRRQVPPEVGSRSSSGHQRRGRKLLQLIIGTTDKDGESPSNTYGDSLQLRGGTKLPYARFFAVLGVATATATVLVTTSGCSGQAKTAAGLCQVYHQQETQYLAKYGKPTNSGLADLGQLIGALSDWVPIFQALDQAAPANIEPDVHNILNSLQQEEQDVGQEASNPLGGFASSLIAGMMSTASWENVSNYIEQNCAGGGT